MPSKALLTEGLNIAPWALVAVVAICAAVFAFLAIRLKDCPDPLELRCGWLFRLRRGLASRSKDDVARRSTRNSERSQIQREHDSMHVSRRSSMDR
jgi:hypothetical protein